MDGESPLNACNTAVESPASATGSVALGAPAIPHVAAETIRKTEGVTHIPGVMPLHFDRQALSEVQVGWHRTGPADAPVVAVLGGISADRVVAAEEGGWWAAGVGHDRGVDTRRWQVLGIDYLGGSFHSTGPSREDTSFATLSTYDQAAALLAVLDDLGIAKLHAIVGASYGGMVALAFAQRFPERVGRLVVMSAAERAHPLSTAWRSVQREIVRFGLRNGDGTGGLKLARALAMATYRSGREFKERFEGTHGRDAEGIVRFPVENYLHARGDAYAARHFPAAFLCLSESIDLHAVEPTAIATPATLVAVREDQLVPLGDMQALARRLPDATLHVIDSIYGHDAFLKEREQLLALFSEALQSP